MIAQNGKDFEMANVMVNRPFTNEELHAFSELLNKAPTVSDRFQALFDDVNEIDAPLLENAVMQYDVSANVSLHSPGEIVEMSDGRKYEVQDNGQWKRVP